MAQPASGKAESPKSQQVQSSVVYWLDSRKYGAREVVDSPEGKSVIDPEYCLISDNDTQTIFCSHFKFWSLVNRDYRRVRRSNDPECLWM